MSAISDHLLKLLHIVVGVKSTVEDVRLDLTEQDWSDVFEVAARQGVLALTYSAVQQLPVEQRPPRILLLKWALSTEAIENRYHRQLEVAQELTQLFAKHGVRATVLKGIGLSMYYPCPHHRECGDLDLWLDDYQRGNQIIAEFGVPINYDQEKHAVFYYKGVMVENHAHLLSKSSRQVEQLVGAYLSDAIMEPIQLSEGFYVPSPKFNAYYLLRHMARHFGIEGINLRILLDWGLFLRSNHDQIDLEDFHRLLVATGYGKAYDVFTALAGQLLEEDSTRWQIAPVDAGLQQRVCEDVWVFGVHRKPTDSIIKRGFYKLRKLYSCAWKYRLVLPEQFVRDVVWPSIVAHLRRPRTI